jgi:hypothetical protein
MRIRTIKPEFFLCEELFDLEMETGLPLRVAYAGLWCAADREGRFEWRPRMLQTQILPYDNADFSRVLDALRTRGFVVKYTVNDRDYGVIPSFTTHQVINNREKASQLPAPPEEALPEPIPTRASRVDDACPTPLVHTSAEGKGREQGKEGNKECTHTPGASAREDLPDWAFDLEELRNRSQPWARATRTSPEVVEAWIEHRLSSNWFGQGGRPLQPNAYDLLRFARNYAEIAARNKRNGNGKTNGQSQPLAKTDPTPEQEQRVAEFLRTWWPEHRHEGDEQSQEPRTFAMILDIDLRYKAQDAYRQWTPQQTQPQPLAS